jgi:hypothetical protein
MELRGEEGEMVDRCGEELGAMAPWRARPGRRWEAVQGRRWWRSPALVLKEEEEARWAEWAKRPNRPMGLLGQNLKWKPFQNKNWIFEFTWVLQICTRRFWRNYDVEIFPNFF